MVKQDTRSRGRMGTALPGEVDPGMVDIEENLLRKTS
jgi:hypothetical protein